MQTAKIFLEGLQTEKDADMVLHAINEVWGVRQAEVTFETREAVFSYDESAASFQDFEQAVIDAGFAITKK